MKQLEIGNEVAGWLLSIWIKLERGGKPKSLVSLRARRKSMRKRVTGSEQRAHPVCHLGSPSGQPEIPRATPVATNGSSAPMISSPKLAFGDLQLLDTEVPGSQLWQVTTTRPVLSHETVSSSFKVFNTGKGLVHWRGSKRQQGTILCFPFFKSTPQTLFP